MNFQNIPRSDKVVKTAFVPKLDTLLLLDYKNIEPRIMAYYMAMLGDRSMADVFVAGEDIYTTFAQSALGLSRPLTDDERQVGKVLNLSIGYGGGTPTLMRQLGISYGEAKHILDTFKARWPGVEVLKQSINDRIQERGYITTLWGRHLHPDSEHKALNALIQGCAADLMKSALVKIDVALMEADATSHIVSVIHDEVILDATEKELPWLVEVIPGLMRDERIHSVVPIDVDIEVSRTNWADKGPYLQEVA